MEEWIGPLMIIGMVPGLILLVCVVVSTMFRLKSVSRTTDAAMTSVSSKDAPDHRV